jgi:hypothetical protein
MDFCKSQKMAAFFQKKQNRTFNSGGAEFAYNILPTESEK